jgi:hypothetical protein
LAIVKKQNILVTALWYVCLIFDAIEKNIYAAWESVGCKKNRLVDIELNWIGTTVHF